MNLSSCMHTNTGLAFALWGLTPPAMSELKLCFISGENPFEYPTEIEIVILREVGIVEDRLTRGFFVGLAGGIVSNAFSFLAGAMNLTTIRQADLIGLIVYAHTPPFGFGEIAFALLGHLIVSGVLGVGFAYWVPHVTSRALWLKGWLYSVAIWFAVYGITTLFKLPGTVPTPFKTAVADFVGATIFGVVLALALRALTPKENTNSLRASMAPVIKPLEREGDEN